MEWIPKSEKLKVSLEFGKETIFVFIIALGLGYLLGSAFGIPFIGKTVATSTTPTPTTTQQARPLKFDIPSYVPAKGSDSAKVTLVEFGDYQCPFCEKFFSQTEPSILQNYVNTGKVKFYFIDFNLGFLGPDSVTLAEGSWCANEQGLYYQYHDYIYSHQGQEATGWATPTKLKALVANMTGLDAQQFSSCLDSNKYQDRVQQDTQLGQTNGVSGTPTFYIGNAKDGYTMIQPVGAIPYANFKQAIDALL